jgi:hypothetical protein
MARLWPINLGSRTVPPSISGTPHLRQNTPNTAVVSATRRSHHSASSSPPATACPWTAAITGFARTMRVGPIGPSPSGTGVSRFPLSVPTALRSAPAQNASPTPPRTATEDESSASKARNASASAEAVGPSTALRATGRLIRTVVTGPAFSTWTCSTMGRPPRWFG